MPKILICEFFLFIGKHFWLWKGEQIVGPTNVQNINIFFTQIGLEFAAFSRFLHLERLVKIVPTSEIQDFHLPLPMQQPLLTQSIKQLQVKFNIYSEKATKFSEIFTFDLTITSFMDSLIYGRDLKKKKCMNFN